MAANFKIGEQVKLIATVPEGPVKALSVNSDGSLQYLIVWQDVDGVNQETWFKEESLTKA